MSASLVGSEMCIRDSGNLVANTPADSRPAYAAANFRKEAAGRGWECPASGWGAATWQKKKLDSGFQREGEQKDSKE
eukprot:14894560-Alexandrium_andersonii.AAC.1